MRPPTRLDAEYYGAFYRSELYRPLQAINAYLMRWIRKKYKRLHTHQKATAYWLRIPSQNPKLFAHWAWVPQSG